MDTKHDFHMDGAVGKASRYNFHIAIDIVYTH